MTTEALVIGKDPRNLLNYQGELIAIDTETTGLKWEHDLLGFSLAWRNGTGGPVDSCYVSIPAGQASMVMFSEPSTLQDPAGFLFDLLQANRIAGHNLPFDYRTLFKGLNVPPIARSLDTMHLAKCLSFEESLSLANLAKKHLGDQVVDEKFRTMKSKRKGLAKVPVEDVAWYAREDAEITLQLAERLDHLAQKHLPVTLRDHDEEFSFLVMRLVKRGVPVDVGYVETTKRQHRQRIMEIETTMARKGLSYVGSDKQVRSFFANMGIDTGIATKTGRMSVSAEALEEHKHVEEVALVIEHRQLNKAISSWFNPLLRMASLDNKAHSQLYPFGTRSFRMSSEDINLQGLPMEERGRAFGSMLGVFASDRAGMALYSVDLQQAELRLATMLAGESNLAEILYSGADPYTNMSHDLWNTESRRQDAKRATLSSLYEVGPATFADTYDVSYEEAKATLGRFRRRYPRIKSASRKWETYVKEHGYIPLPDLHRRYFGPYDEEWKAFNQVVQGTVAASMASVMLQTEQALPGRLVLQVHDSIVLYLPYAHEYPIEHLHDVNVLRKIVDNVLPSKMKHNVEPQVPLPIDVKLWQLKPEQQPEHIEGGIINGS
jgi:DNA polymerase-1